MIARGVSKPGHSPDGPDFRESRPAWGAVPWSNAGSQPDVGKPGRTNEPTLRGCRPTARRTGPSTCVSRESGGPGGPVLTPFIYSPLDPEMFAQDAHEATEIWLQNSQVLRRPQPLLRSAPRRFSAACLAISLRRIRLFLSSAPGSFSVAHPAVSQQRSAVSQQRSAIFRHFLEPPGYRGADRVRPRTAPRAARPG